MFYTTSPEKKNENINLNASVFNYWFDLIIFRAVTILFFFVFIYLYLVFKDDKCEFIKSEFNVLMPNNRILAKQKAVAHFDFETHVNF